MPKKKFYNTRPKYTLYFRKIRGKRWYVGGEVYWDKASAEKDKKWLNSLNTGYVYKVMPYKGTWRKW